MQCHRPFTAALLTVVAVAALLGAGRLPAGAATGYRLDPARNIAVPAGAFGTYCTNDPLGQTCQRIMINGLNHARSALGQPAYKLPARFRSLRPTEQLLVLSNLDRVLYARVPISGLNTTLNASARAGASNDADPAFVAVGGVWPSKCGSNWAGPMGSPLVAYFYWMYHDGPDWAHRNITLMTSPTATSKLVMGAGSATNAGGAKAWTELFEAFPSTTRIGYLPTVVLLSSHSGPARGGSDVAIAGFGFGRVTGVTFGGVSAGYRVDSLHVIHAVSPSHQSGKVFVRVSTRAGTSNRTAAAGYWYS